MHDRDRGRCVRCGAPATNIQHRDARGMGGRHGDAAEQVNSLSRLLSVCGSGNTGCHGWIETNRAQARHFGYAVRRNNSTVDPATVPVFTVDGWQLFGDDGSRTACPAPAQEAA